MGANPSRQVATCLAQRAAVLLASMRGPDGTVPQLEDAWADDGRTRRHDRRQWRDAGTAHALREAEEQFQRWADQANPLGRDGAHVSMRAEAWLTSREIEYDGSADQAMSEVARQTAEPDARYAAVARAAYIIGMGAGIRCAREVWAEVLESVSARLDRRAGIT